jgi:hypothetical protein
MLSALTSDVVVHTWDLAVATDVDPHLDPELCTVALDQIDPASEPSAMRAAAVAVADTADAPTRLVAAWGRDPMWTSPASE